MQFSKQQCFMYNNEMFIRFMYSKNIYNYIDYNILNLTIALFFTPSSHDLFIR